jgi:hypothetical protein
MSYQPRLKKEFNKKNLGVDEMKSEFDKLFA